MRFTVGAICFGVCALSIPLSSYAASLTDNQIQSVLMLLKSFDVDSATLASVTSALQGSPMPQRIRIERAEIEDQAGEPGSRIASSTAPLEGKYGEPKFPLCPKILRPLMVGAKGEDVKQLQMILAADPESGFTGTTTGYFGQMTAQAVARFQRQNGIATSSVGYVGDRTRLFLEKRCTTGATTTPPVPVLPRER